VSVHGVKCRSRHGQVHNSWNNPLWVIRISSRAWGRPLQAQETKGPCLDPYLSAEMGPRGPQRQCTLFSFHVVTASTGTEVLTFLPLYLQIEDAWPWPWPCRSIRGQNSKQNNLTLARPKVLPRIMVDYEVYWCWVIEPWGP